MAAGVEDAEVGRAKVPTTDHSSLPSIVPPNFFSFSREMARTVDNKRAAVQKKSNAVGFSRRLARKKARQSTSVDDVYEFQAEKVRRSKVVLRLTNEELAELGRDNANDSEDDNPRGGQPQPRLIGQNSDGEEVDSEDDEDIDSDAAFGESDEETFAGYGFIRKVRWILQYSIPNLFNPSLPRVSLRKSLNSGPRSQKLFTLRLISTKATKESLETV